MFLTHEDGYYALTTAGYALAVAAIAALILLSVIRVRTGKRETGAGSAPPVSVKQLVFSAAALALAFVTSYIRIFAMPWGGSVTLCSMLFVVLIGYWYGPRIGLTAAFAYGLLEFVQDGGSYILSPLQAGLDYIFAFTALGLSGFFHSRRKGLLIGYIVAILARGFFHTVGGYLYWMDYMPENFPANLAAVYPIVYNYSYILIEGVITVILISIPAVRKGLERSKLMATQ